jgi:phage baseplate assembly protein W
MSDHFVGAGWAFPLRTDPTGRVALVRRDREIEESIRLILGTAYGERPMRPDFGCEIHDYVLGPVTPDMTGRMASAVRESLVRWEPRIEVEGVDVSLGEDPGVVYIDIRYSVGETNDPRNLVFPFYTLGTEQ